jgi:Tfp pilus assembly protein PilO
MSDPVASVLGNDFKKPFMVIVAVVSTVVVILAGFSKIESMVDERIDIKLASQKTVSEDHERRLTKIEEKLGSMNDVLAEIRADVKVLRAQSERK